MVAERVGFEPTVPVLAAHTISSRVPSASSDISPQFCRAMQLNNFPAGRAPFHRRNRFLRQKPASIGPLGRLLNAWREWRRGWDLNPRSRF